MGSWVRFSGKWRYRAGHRSQRPRYDPRVWSDPMRGHNCTVYSTLEWLDQETEGVKGPSIRGEQFRAKQYDTVGGISIADAQIALRAYGGPIGEMRNVVPIAHGVSDITFDALWQLSRQGRPIVWQGDNDVLIDAGVAGSTTFHGGHAIVTLGQHSFDDRALGSDPLRGGIAWYSRKTLYEFERSLAGARILLGSLPLTYPAKVQHLPGTVLWFTVRDGRIVGQQRAVTKGFTAFSELRVKLPVAGKPGVYRWAATVLTGGHKGKVMYAAGPLVRYWPG